MCVTLCVVERTFDVSIAAYTIEIYVKQKLLHKWGKKEWMLV